MNCSHKGKCFGACSEQKSPAEMVHGQKAVPHTSGSTKEHDTIVSKITGKKHEISLGPNSGGLVPANPFASIQQQHFLEAHPEKVGGRGKLKEWEQSTDYSSLPRKASKK